MILRPLDEILETERDVRGPNFASRRLLLKRDGMGFSMHDTVMPAGTETTLWYANHLEAVYCIEGTGEIEDLVSGLTHALGPAAFMRWMATKDTLSARTPTCASFACSIRRLRAPKSTTTMDRTRCWARDSPDRRFPMPDG